METRSTDSWAGDSVVSMGASSRVRALLLVAVVLNLGYPLAIPARAQGLMHPTIVRGWLFDPGLTQWGYWYSPCYPFVSCFAYQQFQIWERRQERLEELRSGQAQPSFGVQNTGTGLADRGGGRTTRSTNDADVQPAYADSGRIRDQYAGSGDFLPEFLDRPGGSSQ